MDYLYETEASEKSNQCYNKLIYSRKQWNIIIAQQWQCIKLEKTTTTSVR